MENEARKRMVEILEKEGKNPPKKPNPKLTAIARALKETTPGDIVCNIVYLYDGTKPKWLSTSHVYVKMCCSTDEARARMTSGFFVVHGAETVQDLINRVLFHNGYTWKDSGAFIKLPSPEKYTITKPLGAIDFPVKNASPIAGALSINASPGEVEEDAIASPPDRRQ